MQVFSEKVSLGSVGSATGSATGSVGSVEGTKIAIYGAGSVGSVATMGMVARLRNIVSVLPIQLLRQIMSSVRRW